VNERKQFELEEFKNKKDQSQFNSKMINDKLFIKGKEQTQPKNQISKMSLQHPMRIGSRGSKGSDTANT